MIVQAVGIRLLPWSLALIASLASGAASAVPFVPDNDDAIVERLPEQADPSLKEIKRLRAALARDPRNLDIAAVERPATGLCV